MIFSFPTRIAKEWTSDDAKALRDLLESPAFGKALAHVLAEVPKLLNGADVNQTLVASGRVDGFNEALQSLFRLTHEQPPAAKEETPYPDLDDESKWQDNQQEKT